MFRGGKIPHTNPWNKLRLNIKLKENLELAKEVIEIHKTP